MLLLLLVLVLVLLLPLLLLPLLLLLSLLLFAWRAQRLGEPSTIRSILLCALRSCCSRSFLIVHDWHPYKTLA